MRDGSRLFLVANQYRGVCSGPHGEYRLKTRHQSVVDECSIIITQWHVPMRNQHDVAGVMGIGKRCVEQAFCLNTGCLFRQKRKLSRVGNVDSGWGRHF